MLIQEFNSLNLGLFKPKKDQCDICCGYQTQNVSEEDYNFHIQRKTEARKEKEADKKNADKGEKLVVTMDLQALLLCPRLQASALYYKSKLSCHNFTIHRMDNHDVVCYFWHEAEGGLAADSFTSCLEDYITKETGDSKQLTIYSDGCTYQNRNSTLSNLLLHMAVTRQMNITQKYLEPGHTQMECDSIHSTIEQALVNKEISSPANYVEAIKNARRKQPYKVKYLDHNFFHDYSGLKYYQSIRPGTKAGDPVVTDLRQLIYLPDGNIKYKLSHTGEESLLPRNARVAGSRTIKQLYTAKPKIKASKYRHLQQLKSVLRADYHHFYDDLPHEQ